MQRKFVYLSLALTFGLALSAYAQNIILVSENNDLDSDGNIDDYRLVFNWTI